jgi:hypothetical protein
MEVFGVCMIILYIRRYWAGRQGFCASTGLGCPGLIEGLRGWEGAGNCRVG